MTLLSESYERLKKEDIWTLKEKKKEANTRAITPQLEQKRERKKLQLFFWFLMFKGLKHFFLFTFDLNFAFGPNIFFCFSQFCHKRNILRNQMRRRNPSPTLEFNGVIVLLKVKHCNQNLI